MNKSLSEMEKKIAVNFTYTDYTDVRNARCVNVLLAKASGHQLTDLQDAFTHQSPKGMMCLHSLHAVHTDDVSIGCAPLQWKDRRHEYSLSPIFHLCGDLSEQTAPCHSGKLPTTHPEMVKLCAHKLRLGECKNPFMQGTIGAVLFPQLYAKDKQK